jgi:hypothetical protein
MVRSMALLFTAASSGCSHPAYTMMIVCTQIGCTLQSLLGCVLPCIWQVGLFCPVGFRVKFGVQLQPQHCPAVCCLALGKPTCSVLCNLAVLYASLLELPCLVCLPLLLLLLLLLLWRRRLPWDGVRQCKTSGNAVLLTGGGVYFLHLALRQLCSVAIVIRQQLQHSSTVAAKIFPLLLG